MLPYFSERFFNPSAPYLAAKQVRDTYEDYKNRLAHLIGAKGNDLVITSGATEANNLAFTALAGVNQFTSEQADSSNLFSASDSSSQAASRNVSNPFSQAGRAPVKILLLATEHDSVFAAAEAATRSANIRVETIAVDRAGRLDLNDLRHKLDRNTAFVSIALVNGELGTIQPLAEVADLIKCERFRRLEKGENLPLFFHSDASQALGLLNLSVSRLGVDLLTLNSAKVGGPKGVGALYVGHGVKLKPLTYGGGQERGLRAGTENVAGLIGFTVATEDAQKHLLGNRKKYANLTRILREELLKSPVEPVFLGLKSSATATKSVKSTAKPPKPSDHQLANFCPVSLPGIDAERLIYLLEDEVCVSTGAACAASKGEKSKTLQAISLTDAEIAGSLRLSLGPTNTAKNVREAGRKIVAAVAREQRRLGCER